MRIEKLSGSLILIFMTYFGHAIDFTRINISWQYDPLAEVKLRHRVIQNDDNISVFLRITADSLSSWSTELMIQSRYESETHTTLEGYEADTLLSEAKRRILKITFKKSENNLMVVKISKSGIFLYYDVSLKNGLLPFPSIYPADPDGNPVFENYLNSSNFSWKGADSFYAQQYIEDFPLSDPPMADMKPLAPSILPDSSFLFSDSVSFRNNHFYVVRRDSTTSQGVTMLKAAPYYPEFKQLPELVDAMQYILNEPERKSLRNSSDLKRSFDSFWLKTYVTKFRARNAIRNYYNWVKQSNRLFTDFKEGWKTDRGMLFIVFGVPDEVYRSDNEEEWYYDQGPSFEFTVISTFFSPKTYALRRRVDYQNSWYEYLAAIRRGINE
ncbi:MAG: GWxTD domain-containing protein [Cyclobacteriaceae bacterium]